MTDPITHPMTHPMTRRMIKICGINTAEAMDAALQAGATHVGLVHYEPSPRHVSLEVAARLRTMARGKAKAVLLLVNADVETTARALEAIAPDIVQLHGRETPEWADLLRKQVKVEVWKAMGVKSSSSLEKSHRYKGKVDRLLFDAPAAKLPGGNGVPLDWSLLTQYDNHTPWGLAGGLTPDNVGEAIRQTNAELVDTSSGVESAPGVKDVDLIRAFCEAVRAS